MRVGDWHSWGSRGEQARVVEGSPTWGWKPPRTTKGEALEREQCCFGRTSEHPFSVRAGSRAHSDKRFSQEKGMLLVAGHRFKRAPWKVLGAREWWDKGSEKGVSRAIGQELAWGT